MTDRGRVRAGSDPPPPLGIAGRRIEDLLRLLEGN